MLVRALLQTSLVLWLAQLTLQGAGVGVGVKPGAMGALGAMGNRYGSKAMKTGIGRYPGAQLGAGGYRALGVGGRTGLRPGGYAHQGVYGSSLGTGMGLGAGLPNGLGMGLGHGAKRAYGAGLGSVPGYGTFAGFGYPGARQGVSAADLGGPEVASLGQALQDLKREKSSGVPYGNRAPGLEMPSLRRTDIHEAASPELQTDTGFRPAALPSGSEVKSLDPPEKLSSLGPVATRDEQSISLAASQAQVAETYKPGVSERRGAASLGPAPVTGGERQQLPKDNAGSQSSASSQLLRARGYDSPARQNQRAKNCGSASDLPDEPEINRHELLGSETRSLPHLFKGNKRPGEATLLDERTFRLPLPQIQDVRGYGGGPGGYLGANLGAGGYGPGLGQGAYLGGAAGKLGGYGDGATGYLGAMAGNGYGYGNGYADAYGAGLGYPAELAAGAENKAGKLEALSAGAYAGQAQGAYGALGAGLESNGGKYGGGAAQVPYGNAPGIPTGLEGDGGYPYAPQQLALSAEGAKTASKYGAGAGAGAGAAFRGQQPGYGAQLGATQEGLGEQAGKFGRVNDPHGNGYKG